MKGLSLGCEALLLPPSFPEDDPAKGSMCLRRHMQEAAGQLQTHLVRILQGVDVERQEEPVEQVVCEHIIEELTVDDQDVIEIVQVVQVLSHQVTQFPPIPVPEREMFSVQRPRLEAFSINI